MKTENTILNDNLTNTSQDMARKLLQGWKMLDSICHICNQTPLLKKKNNDERFCARCNIFTIVKEEDDNKEIKENENNNISNNFDKNKVDENLKSYKIYNVYNEITEENKYNEKEEKKNDIQYIKEIKLENEEFNELFNKADISKNEIENLMTYKNYIKNRCGYNVGEWLNNYNYYDHINNKKNNVNNCTDNINNLEGKNEKEINNIDIYSQSNYNFKENIDKKNTKNDLNFENKLFFNNKCLLEKEYFALCKTNDILVNKLEKYNNLLNNSKLDEDEIMYIEKIRNIVTLIEKIKNLKTKLII